MCLPRNSPPPRYPHLLCAVQNSDMVENTMGMEPPTPRPANRRIDTSVVRLCDAADSAPNRAFINSASSKLLRRPGQGRGGQVGCNVEARGCGAS